MSRVLKRCLAVVSSPVDTDCVVDRKLLTTALVTRLQMPRVGATDDQKREEERAVLAHLIKRMVAAKVPPSIPLLPGRDRSVEVPPILLEGGALAGLAAELLGVSSDVRPSARTCLFSATWVA